MTKLFALLTRLYPFDVRYAYGDEMVADFDSRLAITRDRGALATCRLVAVQFMALMCDAAVERIQSLYSHRTFHGRCQPDLGVVRPPNMGKAEWFG